MSKPSTSRLTPSRKNRRRAARLDLVDWRDAMDGHCWRLDTLAEVLEACGQPLEPPVLEGIGHILSREIEAMKKLIYKLEAAR